MNPLFSIGVTTYDREDLLREAVQSVLSQTYADFEMIIGNDNPRRLVTREFLGVQDSRIRIVNHRQNLGEHENMNALLRLSRGRYFTWLADDDLYAPEFLAIVKFALERYDNPPCVFTGFVGGRAYTPQPIPQHWPMREYASTGFLDRYLSREIRVMGCCGVFERETLRSFGGMQQLGSGFSPYSDNLLAILCGLLPRVVYIDIPLVFYRAHEHSPSHSSTDVKAFATAQRDLVRKAHHVFGASWLAVHAHTYRLNLLRWCLIDLASVVQRGKASKVKKVLSFWKWAGSHLVHLRDPGSILHGLLTTVKLSARACRN